MPFIGKQSTSNSQITNYTTTVGSGGQTNFTVVIEGGDETHVYLNGVLLKETTDYTVSSTQVSLVSPAVENDIVEIKVFRSFALADAVRATGGTFSGNVSFGDNNITNVGDISLDTISSDAGTSIGVNLGTDSGDDFNVGSGKLVVEGDTGNVGIGTTSPSSYDSSHDNLVIVGTGNEGLTIISGTSSNSTIAFGDGTGASGYQGMIAYLNADSAMIFRTTAVERMRIDSSGNLKFNSGFGSVETAYGCRAWVNFDGTSGSIGTGRASANISSITDNGTGDYTVNFTTSMPDSDYAVTACGNQDTVVANAAGKVVSFLSPTTSSVRVRSGWFNNDRDFIYVCIAVFR